jgi:hypothetical protein
MSRHFEQYVQKRAEALSRLAPPLHNSQRDISTKLAPVQNRENLRIQTNSMSPRNDEHVKDKNKDVVNRMTDSL